MKRLASALLLAIACLLLQTALLPNAVAADQAAPAKVSEGAYECKPDKSNLQVCKRAVSQEARRMKQCRWKCSTSCPGGQCVEICRGSGQECNGKSPPGW